MLRAFAEDDTWEDDPGLCGEEGKVFRQQVHAQYMDRLKKTVEEEDLLSISTEREMIALMNLGKDVEDELAET